MGLSLTKWSRQKCGDRVESAFEHCEFNGLSGNFFANFLVGGPAPSSFETKIQGHRRVKEEHRWVRMQSVGQDPELIEYQSRQTLKCWNRRRGQRKRQHQPRRWRWRWRWWWHSRSTEGPPTGGAPETFAPLVAWVGSRVVEAGLWIRSKWINTIAAFDCSSPAAEYWELTYECLRWNREWRLSEEFKWMNEMNTESLKKWILKLME